MSYGRARCPAVVQTLPLFTARDGFDQSAGALAGKTLPVGGTWTKNTAAVGADFSASGAGTAIRTATSDGPSQFNDGCVEFASGTSAMVNTQARLVFATSVATNSLYQGMVLRLPSATSMNDVLVVYQQGGFLNAVGQVAASIVFNWFKPVGLPLANAIYALTAQVDSQGKLYVWYGPTGSAPGSPLIADQHSSLATAGALATGRVGPFDRCTAGGTITRTYYDFSAGPSSVDAAIFSGRNAVFTHEDAQRQNAAGTASGRVPVFEGRHLTAPPATRAGLTSRLVVRSRRLDVDSGLPVQGRSDNLRADLTAEGRVVLLSG